MTFCAPSASNARVSPPGPGPISTIVVFVSGAAARAMQRVRLKSKRKFWPSDFLAKSPCAAATSRSGGRPSSWLPPIDRGPDFRMPRIIAQIREWTSRSLLASLDRGRTARRLTRKAQGSDKACRIGYSFSCDIESRAVVCRGADQGQAQGHVDRAIEGNCFHRDQCLIVIHSDDCVVAFASARTKQSVRRVRFAHRHARGREVRERRRNDLDFLACHCAALACVRVRRGERQARIFYSKERSEIPRGNETCFDEELARQQRRYARQRNMNRCRDDGEFR